MVTAMAKKVSVYQRSVIRFMARHGACAPCFSAKETNAARGLIARGYLDKWGRDFVLTRQGRELAIVVGLCDALRTLLISSLR